MVFPRFSRRTNTHNNSRNRNIQVENPVSILDQEESKKFLCGKPEDKYRFFMKATDLERMDNNYAATIDQLRELETAKVRAEESLESLRQTEEYLKQRWKRHDAVQRQERKVEKARCELLWALYNEANEAYRHSLAVRIIFVCCSLHSFTRSLVLSSCSCEKTRISWKSEAMRPSLIGFVLA
jgi:chromosome segregation ATPase